MKKINLLLTAFLGLALVVAVRSWPGGPPLASVAQARAEEDDSGRGRWEYCAVTRAQYPGSVRGGVFWIVYFRGGGVQPVDVEAGVGGNAQGRAIAKLGEEGWEMVGEGALDARQTGKEAPTGLFFKRLRK